jgi:hypothetical protein
MGMSETDGSIVVPSKRSRIAFSGYNGKFPSEQKRGRIRGELREQSGPAPNLEQEL